MAVWSSAGFTTEEPLESKKKRLNFINATLWWEHTQKLYINTDKKTKYATKANLDNLDLLGGNGTLSRKRF